MVIASGASAKSQQALGTVVMGGMIAVVILALLMVPVFYTVVQRAFAKKTEADLREEGGGKVADGRYRGRAAEAGAVTLARKITPPPADPVS